MSGGEEINFLPLYFSIEVYEMKIPEIKIDGKVIKANTNIKMKVWREYLKVTSENESESIADLMDKAIKIICIVFDNDKVTKDNIDEYVNVNDVIPLLKDCNSFMQALTFERLDGDEKNAEKG